MIRIITAILILVLVSVSSNVHGQTTAKAACSEEKYQQFDFWVGDWNVFDKSGKLVGTSTILKLQNNCVMQENWISKTSTSRGTSYNYYNKADDSWNQVWIDNSGYSLKLKGKLIDGKMVLKSDLVKTKKGDYYNRITWSKNSDDSVVQVWDYISTKNTIIQEVFRGIYKKKSNN